MLYCLNPLCSRPENPETYQFCSRCGSPLVFFDRFVAHYPLKPNCRTFLGVDRTLSPPIPCILKQISLKHLQQQTPQQAMLELRKEVEKLQRLNYHPQIPKLYAYFEPNSSISHQSVTTLIQEYITGKAISQEVFQEQEILELLADILPILQFIHQQGIIHRDINPENIIRPNKPNSQGLRQLFLVDFSTAKITQKTMLAKQGTMLGTADYTAPEQLRGKAHFASDIYSLGMVCIHLLTRIHPFVFYSSAEGVKVWQDYLPEPINIKLRGILNKMIAENLSDRYENATQILQVLDLNISPAVLTGSPSTFPILFNPKWQVYQTLNSHLNTVYGLTFSSDGQYLASASADQTVKLWKVLSGNLIYTFNGHKSIVTSLVFSLDQNYLITASWDYQIIIWDVNSGKIFHQWKAHTGWINCITNSPCQIISGGMDKKIKIWDGKSYNLKHTIEGDFTAITALKINHNQTILVSGHDNGMIYLWSMETQQLISSWKAHEQQITSIQWTTSNKLLLTSGIEGTVKTWSINPIKLLQTMAETEGSIEQFTINSRGNQIITIGNNSTLKIWQSATGQLLYDLGGHTNGIKSVAISPNDQIIATGSPDKTIKLWHFQ